MSNLKFLIAARKAEKAMKPYKLLPWIFGNMQKFIIKSKIEKLFSVIVTEITREWITVKSTDENTEHLNKSMLHNSIMLECDLQVIIL